MITVIIIGAISVSCTATCMAIIMVYSIIVAYIDFQQILTLYRDHTNTEYFAPSSDAPVTNGQKFLKNAKTAFTKCRVEASMQNCTRNRNLHLLLSVISCSVNHIIIKAYSYLVDRVLTDVNLWNVLSFNCTSTVRLQCGTSYLYWEQRQTWCN